jgi:hypothetical protein
MNFDHMPELRWRFGYFVTLGVMLAIAIVMLIYFRRRGWLGNPRDDLDLVDKDEEAPKSRLPRL